jgi:NitT/TauT family transport system substrate-binding protein
MRNLTTKLVAVLAALALLAAACGDGDDTAVDPGAGTPAETAAPTVDEDTTEDDSVTTDDAGDETAQPAELRTVRMGVVGTAMQMTFAPYTSVPMHMGYFAEEGIELEIQSMPGSAEILQAIATGQLDVGVILSPPLYSAANQGIDVTSFCNLITTNFAVPHVLADSPIEEILDIQGTTVGVVSPGAGAIALVRAMVAREGGDPDSIDFIPVGAGADVAVVAEKGEIDVIGLWDAVFANLRGMGLELRPISNEFFDNLGFQGPILASRTALENDPELYTGFGRAVAKGMVFTQTNPEAAVEAHWTVFPDTRPTGVDDDQAMATALAAIEARLASSRPVDGRWCYATREQIIEFAEVLVDGGGLDAVPDPDDVFYGALIDDINDFDQAAVEDQARNNGG